MALADSLLRQVTELKRRTEDLVGELDLPFEPPEPEPEPEPDPDVANGNGAGPDLSAERLVALQMALSGKSREEVAEYLRRSYASSDSSATLDEIFGPAA